MNLEKMLPHESSTGSPLIAAVDFDGTLVEGKFPEIGKPNYELVDVIKELSANGVKIILWTCRTDENLAKAVQFCKWHLGLNFDAVNENLPEIIELYGNNARKIYADLYIDDKALPWDIINEMVKEE